MRHFHGLKDLKLRNSRSVQVQDFKLISVDLAKNVFQVCILNSEGDVVLNKKFKRQRFLELIASYKPTTIAMESCYSANHFGRTFEIYGYTVKLIPAQHVKAFVRGNKNDANDALAIAEASQRPNLRCVKIKTIEQQDIQSIHRIRDHKVAQRTALTNQVRGLLTEYGLVAPVGDKAFKLLIHNALESNQIIPLCLKRKLPLFMRNGWIYRSVSSELKTNLKLMLISRKIASA